MRFEKKKIALLIYSCPFHFPPTINAANILSERGFEVHLLGLEYKDDWSQQLNKDVKLVHIGGMSTSIKGIIEYFSSILFLRRYLKRNHIETIIGYDAKSVLPAFLATRLTAITWIFHQHDYWETPRSIWERFLWEAERKLVKYAYKVSFPQRQRAEHFRKVAALREAPLIVYNGPRKEWINHFPEPHQIIREMRMRHKYLLIYQGGWSVYFGLERIFDALSVCKTDTALIMLGEEREKGLRSFYQRYLGRLGICDRVYLAEKYISYEALPSFTRYADAAIGKLTGEEEKAPFNDRFLIGAANKITEYIACGLPVILQKSMPNNEFLEQYPIGIVTETKDQYRFAKDIDELLTDDKKRNKISVSNKRLFMECLNFDTQFEKIISILEY